MEKKPTRLEDNPEESFTSEKRSISRTNFLQIGDNDASFLVGSIVEKGISDERPEIKPFPKTAPPNPSVLPFPVARHRSHGPLWNPRILERKGDFDHGDHEDDEADTFLNAALTAAKPVERRPKKCLDLSKLKEPTSGTEFLRESTLMSKSGLLKISKPNNAEAAENQGKIVSSRKIFPPLGKVDVDSRNGQLSASDDMRRESRHAVELGDAMRVDCSHKFMPKSDDSPLDVEESAHYQIVKSQIRNLDSIMCDMDSAATVTSSISLSGEGVSESGQTEIDAENRARVRSMSSEEIAEAQAELMRKMDPTILNMLKKRGQEKSKRQTNVSSSAASTFNRLETVKTEDKSSTLGIGLYSQNRMGGIFPSKELKEDVMQNAEPGRSSLWNAWSERVQAVRNLRFSLDGSVVESDFKSRETRDGRKWPDADSATERDFLRTEGEPDAAGYNIKEALALARSVVPGQRSIALHLLASVLQKAIQNICHGQLGFKRKEIVKTQKTVDWEAVWAYVLGPEPELSLALRMALDDNHSSVVLACAKTIQCALSYDLNEYCFDITEKIPADGKGIFTAPVFRSRPDIDVGFLHGGFWKYSAKQSDVLAPMQELLDEGGQDKHTIQDDIFVAGQDLAAGLVRMGILPRIQYLLEVEHTSPLEECLLSILIEIARHSPTCAKAITNLPSLLQMVLKIFTSSNSTEACPSQIKAVCLFKVLAQADKNICLNFLGNESFRVVTWHLYQYTFSLDSWVKLGKDKCVLVCALMVEQLRLWKVCIRHGLCISYFPELFPALCMWLNPPSSLIMDRSLLGEFCSMSREGYLVMEALSCTLPKLRSLKCLENEIHDEDDEGTQSWSWCYVGPMMDLVVKWMSLTPKLIEWRGGIRIGVASTTHLLWVYSALMHTVNRILEKMKGEEDIVHSIDESGETLPWLPEFVSKIGHEIINCRLLCFSGDNCNRNGKDSSACSNFAEALCCLRLQSEDETTLASVYCLSGLIRISVMIEDLINSAKFTVQSSAKWYASLKGGSIFAEGIFNSSPIDLRPLQKVFMNLVASNWRLIQSIEKFDRGGPAPGVGFGWGNTGGGFWSVATLVAQADAQLLCYLLNIAGEHSSEELLAENDTKNGLERINSALAICLIGGPRNCDTVEKALNYIFQVPNLKYLNMCLRDFLQSKSSVDSFGLDYNEEEYLLISEILESHFRKRWLSIKRRKSRGAAGDGMKMGSTTPLETIHEGIEISNASSQEQDRKWSSLSVEWAHQRLPLPTHWFLSSIATISVSNSTFTKEFVSENLVLDPSCIQQVTRAGLFFILGIESMSRLFPNVYHSPVLNVPCIWKLHSLSVVLLVGKEVLKEERTRNIYKSLQELYGQFLKVAESKGAASESSTVKSLRFLSEINQSYQTLVEAVVEEYAAESYGDEVYGRQVAIYLHQYVDSPVRLAVWNALSNAHVLQLLPSLENFLGGAEGYLEPVEQNEAILEAYVKSWVSGALDRAASRGSGAFMLVMHHLSSYIFLCRSRIPSLRNRLVKSLLRDYSRKRHHEAMMVSLIQYKKASIAISDSGVDIESRIAILKGACDGNSFLTSQVEKLKSRVS